MNARGAALALALLACGDGLSGPCDGEGAGPCGGADATGGQGGLAGQGGHAGQGGAPSCVPGATTPCYEGPAGTKDVGICVAGVATCGVDGVFGACVGQVLPGADDCLAGLDEDCNGSEPSSCADLWSRSFSVSGSVEPTFVGVDLVGNVYLAGTYSGVLDLGSGVLDSNDVLASFVAAFDAAGSPLWSRSFGGDSSFADFDAGITPDGRLVLSGGFSNHIILDETHTLFGPNDGTAFVAAYGPDGAVDWSVVAAGHPTGFRSLAVSPSGTITIGAAGTDLSFGGGDVYAGSAFVLASFSGDGAYLGSRGLAPGWMGDTVLAGGPDDGSVLLLPNTLEPIDFGAGPLGPGSGLTWGRLDAGFAHLSSGYFDGTVSSVYASNGDGGELAIAANGGGIALDGTVLASSQGESMGMIAVLEPDGTVRYGRSFEGDTPEFSTQFFGVSAGATEVVAGGKLIAPASIASVPMVPKGVWDGLLVALDPVGEVAWSARFGGVGTTTTIRALAHHPSGGVLVAGDYSTVQIDASGPDFGQGPLAATGPRRGFLALVHP